MDGSATRGQERGRRLVAAELARRIQELGPWFQDLDLSGHRTAADHPLGHFLDDLWGVVSSAFPVDMTGASVLDIGCNAGFYSLRLAARGARVTAIDHDPRYLAQARLAAEVNGVQLELVELDVYEVDRLRRTFDFVLFMGVFYHLRYPLLALDKVAKVFRRRLVFQTMVRGSRADLETRDDYPFDEEAAFADARFPAAYFIEHRYAGDPTNWWIPNEAGAAAMLRSAGLSVEAHPASGVFICTHACGEQEDS